MDALRTFATFLPFAARFMWRHPIKWGVLARHWKEHQAMLKNLSVLSGKAMTEVLEVYQEMDVQRFYRHVKQEILGQGVHALSISPHSIVPYCLTRLLRPKTVLETGVEHGISSWLILKAMQRNGQGQLHSIDLPNHHATIDDTGREQINHLPRGRSPGWLVPEHLRAHWHLHLGDAKQVLPEVLSTLGSIDIFIHDSLHSYEHMMFEYRAAWPHLKAGGLLLSDDIGWSDAFLDFARAMKWAPIVFREEAGMEFKGRLGALLKPGESAR